MGDFNPSIESCYLSVAHSTAARDVSLMRLTKQASNATESSQANVGNNITYGNIVLGWAGFSTGDSMLQFEYLNKATG